MKAVKVRRMTGEAFGQTHWKPTGGAVASALEQLNIREGFGCRALPGIRKRRFCTSNFCRAARKGAFHPIHLSRAWRA